MKVFLQKYTAIFNTKDILYSDRVILLDKA